MRKGYGGTDLFLIAIAQRKILGQHLLGQEQSVSMKKKKKKLSTGVKCELLSALGRPRREVWCSHYLQMEY